MSYAWAQLRLAVHDLAQAGSQRERLAAAITEHMLCLRPKDFPAADQAIFASLVDRLCIGKKQEWPASIKQKVESLEEKEVRRMVKAILHLYDSVTRFQPIQAVGEIPGLIAAPPSPNRSHHSNRSKKVRIIPEPSGRQ